MKLHHVQLAIPRGSEDECRTFYCDILGWREIKKPPVLAARGGMWLHTGNAEIHLGVEEDFRPARKAHPAFLVSDTEALVEKLNASGQAIKWDDSIAGHQRFFVHDAVGNRLEFMQVV